MAFFYSHGLSVLNLQMLDFPFLMSCTRLLKEEFCLVLVPESSHSQEEEKTTYCNHFFLTCLINKPFIHPAVPRVTHPGRQKTQTADTEPSGANRPENSLGWTDAPPAHVVTVGGLWGPLARLSLTTKAGFIPLLECQRV